eukprot:CAMPEP_0172667678 /NCGR_PEP_ID=MMETSP1074-20121228/8585_1 /TAXON_ID=2916 /ORGANISM="Ceratium fusus, Strain PA161109" /LENGTH=54 /DNA_ID=CAMNT_0013484227 /DNA_START=65 /DNA_END=226 /DNA_ORIENTATION=+
MASSFLSAASSAAFSMPATHGAHHQTMPPRVTAAMLEGAHQVPTTKTETGAWSM